MSENRFCDRVQFLAKFAYVGDSFFGVQEQPKVSTVLGALRRRIEHEAAQRARALYVAARTDRGVHALENYATFYVKKPVDEENLIRGVMADAKDGLLGVKLMRVSPRVHARGNARGKIYRYSILDCTQDFQAVHPFAWQVAPALSVYAMQQASVHLVGEHDFSSLRGGGCQAGSPVKTIFQVRCERTSSGMIEIEIAGNGFLRKMIRNLVGLLVEIGAGLRKPECVPVILALKDRNAAGIMAPAHGLCLTRVVFEL